MTNIVKLIISNTTLANLMATGLRVGAKSIWGLVIPFFLSVNEYGYYNLIIATALIMIQVSVLGAPQIIMRCPETDRVPLISLALNSLGLASICIGLVVFFSPIKEKQALGLLIGLALITIAYQLVASLLKRMLLFYTILIAEFIGGSILLSGLIFLWHNKIYGLLNLYQAIFVEICSVIFMLITLIFIVYNHKITIQKKLEFRPYLPALYSIGFISIIDVLVWKRMEIYFLQASPSGIQGVAVFSLAIMISSAIMFIPGSLIESWYPRIAEEYHLRRESFAPFIKKKLKEFARLYFYFYIFSLPIVLLIVRALFTEYLQWFWYIAVIIGSALFFGFEVFCSNVLYSTAHEKTLFIPTIAGAVVSVVLNSLITVRYGLDGVIIAYIITHAVIFTIIIRLFLRVFKLSPAKDAAVKRVDESL